MRTDSADPLTDTVPIGPLQEGIWLFWQLNPTSPAYSMPEIFHFHGDYDLAAIEFAFNAVIRRHESLRTTFHDTEAGVVLVVDREPDPIPVKLVDLRAVPEADRSERLQATLDAEANQPFDLTREQAVRLTVIRVTDTHTALILVAHHIVCDGLSMIVLFEDFGEFYRSARRGTAPELEPAAPGYTTLVKEQLASLADGVFEEESGYWRERLAGVSGSVLPGADGTTTRRPGSLLTHARSVTLDETLTEQVWSHARRAKSTPFSVLLCALQVMIAAATADPDVAIGMATSGRSPKYAKTVGMLANMVVARSRIELSRPFAAVLDEVTLDLMDAIDHQDLPFSRVVADLHEAGLPADVEVVRTGFSAGALGGLSFGEGDLSTVVARTVEGPFDVVAVCEILPSAIALDWEFADRLYTDEMAGGYCAAYVEILTALLRQPDDAIETLGVTDIVARVVPAPLPSAQSDEAAAVADAAAADVPEASQARALTEVEAAVAAIWSDVIGVPVDAPDDDFFELGGHSTLAGRVVALVRKKISPTASLRLLFDHPKLEDFASRLDVKTEE